MKRTLGILVLVALMFAGAWAGAGCNSEPSRKPAATKKVKKPKANAAKPKAPVAPKADANSEE